MATDYDSAWKELLERFFDMQLAFFFPELHAEIDWSHGSESLATELRKILPEAEGGNRLIDALVKTAAHSEAEAGDLRYLHVEVQCQVDSNFAHRLQEYNARCELRLQYPVATLVILGDDSPSWRPSQYLFVCGGFRKQLDFPTVKLLDYRGREEELTQHANPVGLFVVGHLLTLSTAVEDAERAAGKLRLLRSVRDRKMEAEETYEFTRLIDWIVELPADRQTEMWRQLRQEAQENHMPFLSYPEQVGFDKGKNEGLLQGIEASLDLRFSAAGLALLPELRKREDVTFLQQFLQALRATTTSLDDLRALLAAQ
jgi:hypothetical protein